MHIVHKKKRVDGNPGDDLAVLGIFFNVDDDIFVMNKPNQAIQKLADEFKNIQYLGTIMI